MIEGSQLVKFFMLVLGNAFNSPVSFMDRLTTRLQLHEVTSVDKSDVIFVFIPIVSRAGTDIDAALGKFPQTANPIVIVVLHHTFDPHFMAPDSRYIIKNSNMFTVDCLHHEDRGLLRCLRNDEALKAVADHLISLGALSVTEHALPQLMNRPQWVTRACTRKSRNIWILVGLLLGLILEAIFGIIGTVGEFLFAAVIGGVMGYLIHFRVTHEEKQLLPITH
ncbi:uncharacterized protein [Hoplias malabaricus]|uniref:uncharacterized protein n=1 Tax=Hoplias malabaricus TaxID=27720 RepID=UPI003462CF83